MREWLRVTPDSGQPADMKCGPSRGRAELVWCISLFYSIVELRGREWRGERGKQERERESLEFLNLAKVMKLAASCLSVRKTKFLVKAKVRNGFKILSYVRSLF